jgi:hypothetical protein
MKKLLKALAAALIGIGLSAGMAAAQTGSIDTTGPDSNNNIEFKDELDVDVDNKNDAEVRNDVDQDADSGDADVNHNTTGGDATSGDAMNESELSTSATMSNSGVGDLGDWWGGSGSSSASIDNTGPDSDNTVEFNNDTRIDVDNNNYLDVDNDVDQDADSGDADVDGNTTGGDATSGDAHNSSSVSTTVHMSN